MEIKVKLTITYMIPLILVLIFSAPVLGIENQTDQIKTVAVLPFETNSQKDISFISSGIVSMFHSRLLWKNNVRVVNKDKTTNALKTGDGDSDQQSIRHIGQTTRADYVIAGNITEFSGSYSIDTKIYDIKKGSFLTFFEQSETIDQIIPRVDVVAAKINKKVFSRTTVSYEKFKKDNIITEEELKRMNPERMMPLRQFEEQEEPWWKVW